MEISRRGFLGAMLAAAAVEVASEVIPLNRVWSFPSKIRTVTYDDITAATLRHIVPALSDNFFKADPLFLRLRSTVPIVFDGGKEVKLPLIYGGRQA